MSETWKVIEEFPDYFISTIGRIKRITSVSGTRHKAGDFIKAYLKRDGYPEVCLTKNGKKHYVKLHRLILTAFVSKPPSPTHQANHKNGNKGDYSIDNLEWVTPSENKYHSIRVLGRQAARGENHGLAKLTNQQVKDIKEMLNSKKYRQWQIAKIYSVDGSTISDIKTGVHWSHIE